MSTRKRGMLQRVLMLILVLCLVCGNGLMALADEAIASTMRLTKTEGTVSVTNKNGRDMGTMADMKLFHGYQLTTAQKSYAWMNLDDHKMVKMDAVSEVEIQKKGKDLEILLNSGNLLFNITESLKSDETLNVRTSTMVTGIRGTSGWVKVIDSRHTQVYILEGQVECYVMDPVTGQNKSEVLHSGEVAEFVVYDQTHVGDKCDIIVERYDEQKIDGFVAIELVNDAELREKVTESMDIDMNWINTQAPIILSQDQQNIEQKMAPINEAVQKQEHVVKKDPVFVAIDDDDDDDEGGGSPVPVPPSVEEDAIEITDPVNLYINNDNSAFLATADNLALYLAMENIFNINVYPADGVDNTFMLDRSISIDSGKTVTFNDGIDVYVNEGQTLTINGTMNVTDGDVYNYGSIKNFSNNTLNVTGILQNSENGSINNVGRIVAADPIENHGTITNSGSIEGKVNVNAGRFENQSGSISGDLTVNTGAEVVLNGAVQDGNLNFEGGTVEVIAIKAGLEFMDEIGNGHLIVSEGSYLTDVSVAGTMAGMGRVTVKPNGTILDVTCDNGEVIVDGGSINTIGAENPANGTITVNSGDVGTVTFLNGTLNMTGGTISHVNGSEETIFNISGGSASIDLVGATFSDSEENPTVSISRAMGLLVVEEGKITHADLTCDYDTPVSISGAEIGYLKQETGYLEISSGSVEEAELTNVMVAINGGNIGTMNASYTNEVVTLDMTGGTADAISITNSANNWGIGGIVTVQESAEIGILTVSEDVPCEITGGRVGELYSASDITINESTDGPAVEVGDVTMTAGGMTIYSGTVNSINLIENGGCMIEGGEVTSGIVLDGEMSSLIIGNGTVRSGESGAVLVYNAGALDIYDNANLIIDNDGDLIAFGSDALAANYSNAENGSVICVFDAKSVPIVEESSKGIILKQYKSDLASALQNPQDGDVIMLSNDLELSRDNAAIINAFRGAPLNTQVDITLDLHGHRLTVDSSYTINVGAAGGDDYTLTICDTSETKGVLELAGPINNYVNLVFEDINIEAASTAGTQVTAAITNNADGYLEFNGGTCSYTGPYFLANNQGTVNICNAAEMQAEISDVGGSGGIVNNGGTVTIGTASADTSNDPVEIHASMGTSSMSSMGFITGTSEAAGNDYDGIIELYNVELTVENGSAVNFDGFAIQLVIDEGAIIQSNSGMGTIYNGDDGYDDCIVFNGGEVINTYGEGSYGTIYFEYDPLPDGQPPAIIPGPGEMKTILRSKDASIVTFCYLNQTGGEYNLVPEPYQWEANGYDIGNDGEFYYISGLTSQKLTLRRPEAAVPAPNPEPDHLETATPSDAAPSIGTSSNATSSNASGSPTGTSRSAIPMAAAMLAGLVGIVPKLRERGQERKE